MAIWPSHSTPGLPPREPCILLQRHLHIRSLFTIAGGGAGGKRSQLIHRQVENGNVVHDGILFVCLQGNENSRKMDALMPVLLGAVYAGRPLWVICLICSLESRSGKESHAMYGPPRLAGEPEQLLVSV